MRGGELVPLWQMHVVRGLKVGLLGPLPFLVFIDYLATAIKPSCYSFTGDANFVDHPGDNLVQTNLHTVCAWSSRWGCQ